LTPLLSLKAATGRQDISSLNTLMSDISADPTNFVGQLTIAGNVLTSGNQTYTAQNIQFGNAVSATSNNLLFGTSGGVITFNTGTTNPPFVMNGPNGGLLQFKLGGGSVTGLSLTALTNAGINYQMEVLPTTTDSEDIYLPMRKVFKPELIDVSGIVDVAVGDLESANDCGKENAADSECKAVNQ